MVAGGPRVHHLASCDTYIVNRILRIFDHQAPRAIVTVAVVLQRQSDHASALSHYTQSRSIACMTARLDVTPKTTEQNRIIRTSKSEAEVTNNKKLRSRYYTIDATKLTTDIHEASRGLFAIANVVVVRCRETSVCPTRRLCGLKFVGGKRYTKLSSYRQLIDIYSSITFHL